MSFVVSLSQTVLHAAGWQLTGQLPATSKYVIVAAPHTSGWDVPLGVLAAYSFGIVPPRQRFGFAIKSTVFRGPLGAYLRWLGGIPIERHQRHNLVTQLVAEFKRQPTLALAFTPEGTRGQTAFWKTGFYYTALGAQVPLLLAALNLAHRRVVVGPHFIPTGDVVADFDRIRAFYRTVLPHLPERVAAIRPREELSTEAGA